MTEDAVGLLELILLAKLVRLTGVVWDVQHIICNLNIAFIGRFGADASDVARIEYSVGDIEGLFEDRMEKAATLLGQRYLARKAQMEMKPSDDGELLEMED